MGPFALSTFDPARPPLIASKDCRWVQPGLDRESQGLSDCLYVCCHDDLVSELCDVTRAVASAEDDAGSDGFQHFQVSIEHFLFAPDHDCEGARYSSRFTA